MQIQLETVELAPYAAARGGEYDKAVETLMANGWGVNQGMKRGVSPAQAVGLRAAVNRYNTKNGTKVNVLFFTVAKDGNKVTEYGFRRQPDGAPRRGRAPAKGGTAPVAVAEAAPVVESL